jgi:hypothetical protein
LRSIKEDFVKCKYIIDLTLSWKHFTQICITCFHIFLRTAQEGLSLPGEVLAKHMDLLEQLNVRFISPQSREPSTRWLLNMWLKRWIKIY